jgi:hypothetical protein
MSLIFQWRKKFPSTFNEQSDAPRPTIVADANGFVYIAYVTINPIGSGQTNVGGIDICVVKMNTDGDVIWFRQQPSFDTTEDDIDPAICVDTLGNVYVAYSTGGTASGQQRVTTVSIVVFKLNSNGDTLWVKESSDFETSGNNYAPNIATDPSNNVYVVYYMDDKTVPTEYYDNVILFKLSPEGQLIWTKKTQTFNTPGGNFNPTIAVDDSGNCFVAYFCDGLPASGQSDVGDFDIIIFKTDTDGNLQWIRQNPSFDTSGRDWSPSIVVDTFGSCYVAYYSNGTASGQNNSGSYDIIIFKMDTNGNVIWITQKPTFNTNVVDIGPRIGVDPLERIYVVYSTFGLISGQT